LRVHDIRAQTDSIQQLRTATASIARGLRCMAQICGLLPGAWTSGVSVDKGELADVDTRGGFCNGTARSNDLSVDDILDLELSGQSLAHRMEDTWVQLSRGGKASGTMLDVIQHTAEAVAQRALRLEVGDLEAKVTRACQEFVAREGGLKSARAVATWPAVDMIARAGPHREPSQWPRESKDSQRGSPVHSGLSGLQVSPPAPRSISARAGRVLTASADPPKEWSRASAALAPLVSPKIGVALADLRASPGQRDCNRAAEIP